MQVNDQPQPALSAEFASATPSQPARGFGKRLEFAYTVIKDTQDTIRFLDTKAAFCVTLLTATLAVVLQTPAARFKAGHWLLIVFLVVIGASLLLFLRVISPTIRTPRRHARHEIAGPKFYVSAAARSHRLRHAVAGPKRNLLAESHQTYFDSILNATEPELLASLASTILTLSVIRQVKSDRLHVAMFGLVVAFLLFAILMIL